MNSSYCWLEQVSAYFRELILEILSLRRNEKLKYVFPGSQVVVRYFNCERVLGIFKDDGSYSSYTVCPFHRDTYGVGWRCGKSRCSVPSEVAAHKSTAKGCRGIDRKTSEYLLSVTKKLFPVGTRKYVSSTLI